MDIAACLRKLGYKAVVWGNSYEGIRPHELETRPIPTLEEIESAWPTVQAEAEQVKAASEAKAALEEIDLKSIRSLREWLAAQATAPQWIKDYESQAVAERAKLR